SVTASGLVTIGGAEIDVAGSVGRTTPGGPVEFATSGTLVAPVALAAGARLESASLAWDGESFSGAGRFVISVAGSDLALDGTFGFTDPRQWHATVSVGGSGHWEPVSGLRLTNPAVTG